MCTDPNRPWWLREVEREMAIAQDNARESSTLHYERDDAQRTKKLRQLGVPVIVGILEAKCARYEAALQEACAQPIVGPDDVHRLRRAILIALERSDAKEEGSDGW